MKVSDEVSKYLSELGRKGAKARAAKLSKPRRKEIAVKAAKRRWKGTRHGHHAK
jgi:phage gp16-like protein